MKGAAAAVAVVAAAAAAGIALAACGDDGRELRAPEPGATAPPLPSSTTTGGPTTAVVPGSAAGALVLTSPAFSEGGTIPAEFSCDGENSSPPLSWGTIPADTVELAITVEDPDASGFVHWVVSGLDPSLAGVGPGSLPEGAVEGRNDSSEFGWLGPCPPVGDPAHRYEFRIFALSARSGLEADAPPRQAVAQLAATPGVSATLSATYARP